MNCRHPDCGQPIERCTLTRKPGALCRGWRHSATGLHACSGDMLSDQVAEPEPAAIPLVQSPADKPQGEVA